MGVTGDILIVQRATQITSFDVFETIMTPKLKIPPPPVASLQTYEAL